MYPYFYRFRLLPCHLFFHFSFFIFFVAWSGVCFSCGFLVSVLWMVYSLPFVPLLVPFFAQFRFSPCPSFLSSTRFARFALLPVFRFALSFRLFVWAYRGAVRLGRGGVCGRGGWLVVWRGEMTGRSGCALFLSAHFLVSSRLFSPLLFSSLPSLCSCSSRRACRVAACLASGRWSVSAWRCVVAGCGRCDMCGAAAGRRSVSWSVPWAVR